MNKRLPEAIMAFRERNNGNDKAFGVFDGVRPLHSVDGFYTLAPDAVGLVMDDLAEEPTVSAFHGVFRKGDRWVAKFGKRVVGSMFDEQEAAKLYDVYALGKGVSHEELNFPEKIEEYLIRVASGDGFWRRKRNGSRIMKRGGFEFVVKCKSPDGCAWEVLSNGEVMENGRTGSVKDAKAAIEGLFVESTMADAPDFSKSILDEAVNSLFGG